jgi:hypothetical protein
MSAEEDDAADHAFEQRARAELRNANEPVPPDVHAALDRAVARALEPPPRPDIKGFALPAAAVAVLAGLFLMRPWRAPDAPPASAAVSDDFALLIDADNLDLLEQMEFYQWLDRQPGILDGSASGSAQRS